jgi:hypothetical protein|tara:strand:+ start:216 stop:620 length:405 start_codon:yes stop_codon:yes gene_type:complete
MLKNIYTYLIILFITLSCSTNNAEIETINIIDVKTELIHFNFTPATANTPENLSYSIKFINPNVTPILGFYRITIKSTINNETIESSLLSTSSSECYTIDSDSSCTFSFNENGNPNLGNVDNIEFVSATYTIDL